MGKLSAYRQHRPVPCRVDLPQQDEWREVRLGVPAEAEGGEGQPRHGGDTADIWGQGLVAEQPAAGLRPGVILPEPGEERIVVRCKAGDLHGEQIRGVPAGHRIIRVQLIPNPDPPRLIPAIPEMGVPVQHGGHTPHQSRVQLFAPGLRVPIQRCDIHLRRQIDGGLAENLQILPALPGLLVDGRKGHGAPPSPASSAGRLGHRTTGRAKSPLPPRSMRGENPQLTNLPRRGYNMFQSDDGEGRRPAPSESRRAVEAGGKGLQVLWLLSRGFEGARRR